MYESRMLEGPSGGPFINGRIAGSGRENIVPREEPPRQRESRLDLSFQDFRKCSQTNAPPRPRAARVMLVPVLGSSAKIPVSVCETGERQKGRQGAGQRGRDEENSAKEKKKVEAKKFNRTVWHSWRPMHL